MSEAIDLYISSVSTVYYIKQVAVIMLFYLLGSLLITCIRKGKLFGYDALLAFPTGLSVYAIVSFILLVFGLPFNLSTVSAVLGVIFAATLSLILRKKWDITGGYGRKKAVLCLIAMLCITVISTSGLIPAFVSNDSLYYYSMYPRAIVRYGYLRRNFNTFLTDVGPMSAFIGTVPYLYGFDESFGIFTVLNADTLLLAAYALYGEASRVLDKRASALASAVTVLIIGSSMPYVIMSRWIMSNGYFMCFMFMCTYLVYDSAHRRELGEENTAFALIGILFSVMALLRMEGCIVALILIICYSALEFSGKKRYLFLLLPVFFLSITYDLKVLVFTEIEAPYTFLTLQKAVIQLAAIIAVAAYILFVKDRLPDKIKKRVNILLPAALIIVNLTLLAYRPDRYVHNMLAFIRNFSDQSGWGLFPMMVIGAYLLCFIVSFKGEKGYEYTFWDMCFAAYFLTALAVSFARGDDLRQSIGDSGNRVMMQSVLLTGYAMCSHLIGLLGHRA